jgi:hypothetical protein
VRGELKYVKKKLSNQTTRKILCCNIYNTVALNPMQLPANLQDKVLYITDIKDIAESINIKYYNGSIFMYGKLPKIVEYDAITFKVKSELTDLKSKTVRDIFITDKYLFAANAGKIIQWKNDVRKQKVVRTYKVPGNYVNKILKIMKGRADNYVNKIQVYKNFLFACGENGAVIQWNIDNGKQVFEYVEGHAMYDIRIIYDNLYAINEKDELVIWDLYQKQPLHRVVLSMNSPYFAKSGENERYLYIVSGKPFVLGYFDTLTKKMVKKLNMEKTGTKLVVLNDVKIAFAKENELHICTIDEDNEIECEIKQSVDNIYDIVFAHPGYIFILVGDILVRLNVNSDKNHTQGFEEDSQNFTFVEGDASSIISERSVDSCVNENLITLEPYTEDDKPILVYMPNSEHKFEKSVCSTREELVQYFRAFENSTVPDNIMTIYTKGDLSGHGGEPTGKIVVKLPANNIYVTFGSMRRILHDTTNKTWYGLQLFGEKRRRIGNLKGIFGASMNHGQIPGFQVYKLFSKAEILQGVQAKEDDHDYPYFFIESSKFLFDILNGDVTVNFVKALIKQLVY